MPQQVQQNSHTRRWKAMNDNIKTQNHIMIKSQIVSMKQA